MQHIGFTLNEKEYTIPILKVREIIKAPALTRVPLVPKYVEGIADLRGKIVAIVNLKKLVGLEGHSNGDKVLVVGSEHVRFGFFVDSITGVVDIKDSEACTPTDDGFACALNVNNRALTFLDTKKLIPAEDRASNSIYGKLFEDPDDVAGNG